MPAPTLTRLAAPGTPRAVIVMLHGGKPRSTQEVGGRSASWRRIAAMQRAITPAAHEAGVATWLLRYRERGWNGRGESALDDARWAIDEVRRAHGDVPVVLLGHSMGARTAIHVADAPSVVGVVALAPWFDPSDPVETLRGKRLRAAHGRTDKITSFRMTAAYVERALAVAASAELTNMGRVGHYMLRRVEQWNEFALSNALALLETSVDSA